MNPVNQEEENSECFQMELENLIRCWNNPASHVEEFLDFFRLLCGREIPDMRAAEAAALVQNPASTNGEKLAFLLSVLQQIKDSETKKRQERSTESPDLDE